MATKIKFLTEGKNGAVYYPFTHIKGVLTEDGGNLEAALANKAGRDEILSRAELETQINNVLSNMSSPSISVGADKTLAEISQSGGKVSVTPVPIQISESQVTDLLPHLGEKAPSYSPSFSGTPTAPTASSATSNTQIATTRFVQQEIDRRASQFSFTVAQGSIVLSTIEAVSAIIDPENNQIDVLKDKDGNYIRPATTSKNVVNPLTGQSVFEELAEIKTMLGDIERILFITLYGEPSQTN